MNHSSIKRFTERHGLKWLEVSVLYLMAAKYPLRDSFKGVMKQIDLEVETEEEDMKATEDNDIRINLKTRAIYDLLFRMMSTPVLTTEDKEYLMRRIFKYRQRWILIVEKIIERLNTIGFEPQFKAMTEILKIENDP